jgi:hypothetical protein
VRVQTFFLPAQVSDLELLDDILERICLVCLHIQLRDLLPAEDEEQRSPPGPSERQSTKIVHVCLRSRSASEQVRTTKTALAALEEAGCSIFSPLRVT